ncbi:FGGY-family carbohydrate kinase [Aliiruegeria sabulilitoris]|uniref:FGGY-family carbohydrate kinase n=1 Tax=Aliiruegeria sabulilitoris TaxID=1510458 RepID=UPI0008337F08|nr:FGGY-family carbohydrate kinase [Aliiruegeria sabulilitoris]NDR58706.1 carbohydrate kinase [Pseudoruegeria sp. M32A2M]
MLSLGIDIGTSGVRTAIVSPEGALLSMATVEHLPQPDPARIDAEKWWEAVRACIEAQMEKLRTDGQDPAGIGHACVDGTSGTMLLTDADLVPVSRALMYNSKGFDAEAERIAALAPDPHIARGSGSALGRAMRLVSEAPGARHLLHQADFIAARLTGIGGQSDVMNALKTGVEPDTGEWPDWIVSLLPEGLLPEAHPLGTPLGTLRGDLARELGLPANVQVHAGTTDSIAAFLAAAPLEAGVAVTSLGSTLAIKALSRARIDDPARGLYSHRVGNVWLVGGASNTGGRVLRHFFSDAELAALSEKIDAAQASDLDYYPLIEPGERFPLNDPELQPRLEPRPADDAAFLHGIFEGIARIEAQCYAAISDADGERPTRVLSAGGGAQNPVFTAIRARHLGLTPENAAETEAAIGAARIPLMTA